MRFSLLMQLPMQLGFVRFLAFFVSVFLILVSSFLPHIILAQSVSEPLLSKNNRFDYLIITPAQFANDVRAHAQWRSQATWTHAALRTRIVTLDEINREFGDSVRNRPQAQAEAIRAFVSYALQHWSRPEPTRVMLVGSTNLLPSFRVKVGIALLQTGPFIAREDSVPIDEWFVVNKYREDFSTRPQAAIGRIPGRTSAEIQRVLSKVRLYEEGGNTLGFNMTTRATVVLDAEDFEDFDFEVWSLGQYLEFRARRPLPMTILPFNRIATQPDARRQVTQAMSDNMPIVMYYGHGAPAQWSRFSILTTDGVGNNLARNGRPFMMVTAGCSQNFDIPNEPSIVEAMMLLPDGGASMTVASTGYSSLPENNNFVKQYFEELFTNRIDVGTAMLNAKNRIYTGGLIPQDNFYRRISILGDPAMVPFSRLATSVREEKSDDVASALTIAPNPLQSQTTLQYSLTVSGEVEIEIVNALGQRVFFVREFQAAGVQQFLLNTESLPQGTYSSRIRAGKQHWQALMRVVR